MSVDINVDFALAVAPISIDGWITRFQNLGPATSKVVERWRRQWGPAEWSADPNLVNGNIQNFWGPGGFSVEISPTAVNLYHCSKFNLFVGDAEHREQLRRSFFEFAKAFGSERVVYMPELVPTAFLSGGNLSATESLLRKHYGPPAASIPEIAEQFEPGCYYIDDFKDLV